MTKKKKVFTNYKFCQLFVDKKTNELVEFMCTGFKGDVEVFVLRTIDKKGLIHAPIDSFNDCYTIDKEYVELIVYNRGKKRKFTIENFTGGNPIEARDISILSDRAIESLNADVCELVLESYNNKSLTTLRPFTTLKPQP